MMMQLIFALALTVVAVIVYFTGQKRTLLRLFVIFVLVTAAVRISDPIVASLLL